MHNNWKFFRYELLQKGMLNEEDVRVVPDIYVKYALQFHTKYYKCVVCTVCGKCFTGMLGFSIDF